MIQASKIITYIILENTDPDTFISIANSSLAI